MQRNQRDTQRKNDYSALSAALTQYMNNNNGKLPIENAPNGTTEIYLNPQEFVNDTGMNSSGDYYEIRMSKCGKDYTGGSNAGCNNNTNPKTQFGLGSGESIQTLDTKDKAYFGSASQKGLVAANDVVDQVWVYTNASCSKSTAAGYDVPVFNKSRRAFAIYGAMESGNRVTCLSSGS